MAAETKVMAARLERSRGWAVEQALAAWVDQEEERHHMTLEALADVVAGRVIDCTNTYDPPRLRVRRLAACY